MLQVGVLLPIVSVVVIFAARMSEIRTKRDIISGPIKENLTFRLFMLTGVLMVAGGMIEFILLKKSLSWPSYLAGVACAAASFAIRRRAISALGRFWSLHVEIRDNHEFVRSGPFRWMRHPTYFSMILELVSAGLILTAFLTMLLIPLVFIPALYLRLKLEETALVEKFGDAYRMYQKTTPAIIPYKLPK